MDTTSQKLPVAPQDDPTPAPAHGAGAYEPPRILTRRSVARVTLVSGELGGCVPGDPTCGTIGGH